VDGACQKRRRSLAKIGLVTSIADVALAIDYGRKRFATKGKALIK